MKHRILLILALFSCAIGLTSCEKDAHDPDLQLSGDISEYFPSYSIDLELSYTASSRYYQLKVTPNIRTDLNHWGLHIDQVEYYYDGNYKATVKTSPYKLNVTNSDFGTHTVKAIFTISGKTTKTTTFTTSKSINITN